MQHNSKISDMVLTDSLDEKNKGLYEELKKAGVQIDFEVHEHFQYWAVQPFPKYVIAANSNAPNPEMLAHELLHIKMQQLGFLPTNVIVRIFDPNNNNFDCKEFINLQNSIQHLRMLPMFVDLGYPPVKFVSNSGKEFFLRELLPSLAYVSEKFKSNSEKSLKPSIELNTEFISLIIQLKDYEIQNKYISPPFDTTLLRTELQSADKKLYDELYNLITKWVDSGSLNNYALYANINYTLHVLGYPTQANWQAWMDK